MYNKMSNVVCYLAEDSDADSEHKYPCPGLGPNGELCDEEAEERGEEGFWRQDWDSSRRVFH
jgi:hypothetical protein